MRHTNPYRINNPDDFFEVGENSSHPELQDCRRVWKFGAYSFSTATELQKFFSEEGLNPKNYVMEPIIQRDFSKNLIIINIIEKWKARQKQKLRELRLEQAS